MISCAILGTGKIGIDLYIKIKKSNFVKNDGIYTFNKINMTIYALSK